jgi:small subunit ribosomal protein S8e
MGISRDSRHKRRATGGRMPVHKKKRAFEKGRPQALTKLTTQSATITEKRRIRSVRVRGGHLKFRALRLNEGNFSWGSENVTRKVKIIDVKYNATNNELVRTKTLVKNSIVEIDATPFTEWYKLHYGVNLHLKKDKLLLGTKKTSRHV